jgi:hypothetical protein
VLSGTVRVAAVGGVATFSNLSIDRAGAGYTLGASSGSLQAATSTGFDVTPGAAAKLAFTVQPSDVAVSASIAPAVQVTIQDSFGNRVTSATDNVTLALASRPGGGVLSGTRSVASVAGIASFTGLSIDEGGDGYSLAASSGSLTGAVSGSFNVSSTLPAGVLQAFSCMIVVTPGYVDCSAANSPLHVQIATTDGVISAGSASFNLTLQNLLFEAIGTPDGVTPDTAGINLFLVGEPSISNGTGNASFTNAAGGKFFPGTTTARPYFRWNEMLTQDAVTTSKEIRVAYTPGADTIRFRMQVTTDIQPLLVINEVMANPGGTSFETNGDWVEIYNRGTLAVEMQNMVIADSAASGRRPFHLIASSLVVQPGEQVVLGQTTSTAGNGGVPVNYAWGGAVALASSLDAFKISRVYGTDTLTIDRTQYANAAISAQDGVSRELKNPYLDNSNMDGSNWASASPISVYGAGGRGTPRAQNSTYVATADGPLSFTTFALAPRRPSPEESGGM